MVAHVIETLEQRGVVVRGVAVNCTCVGRKGLFGKGLVVCKPGLVVLGTEDRGLDAGISSRQVKASFRKLPDGLCASRGDLQLWVNKLRHMHASLCESSEREYAVTAGGAQGMGSAWVE
jgi:hypothetical protein